MFLLDTLNDDLKVGEYVRVKVGTNEDGHPIWNDDDRSSIISELFQGTICFYRRCKECDAVHEKEVLFCILDVPMIGADTSVSALISRFTARTDDGDQSIFGETVAIFFAWLDFYTSSFRYAMFFALFPIFYGFYMVWVDNTFWSLFDNRSTLVFAFSISVWSISLLKFWKRRSNLLSFVWDMDHFDRQESVRSEWVAKRVRTSEITGKPERYESKWVRITRRVISRIAIVASFLVLGGVIIGNIWLNAVILQKANGNSAIVSSMALVSTITVLQVLVLGPIYWRYGFISIIVRISIFLNDFENYRLNSNYQNALVWKQFLLNFVNCYSLIFFTGLVRPVIDAVAPSFAIFGASETCQQEGANVCLNSMITSIAIVFGGTQFASQVWSLAFPYFIEQRAKKSELRNAKEFVPKYMLESELLTMTTEMHQSDYNSKVTQLGYVLLFSAPFPFAPILAWINNEIETRSNLYKRLVLYKKPFSEGARGIGHWERVMTVLVHLGFFTTSFLIAFTTEGFGYYLNLGDESKLSENLRLFVKLVVVVIFEHILFLISYAVDYVISDVPHIVQVARLSEDYIDRIRLDEDGERDQVDVENVPELDLVNHFNTLFKRALK